MSLLFAYLCFIIAATISFGAAGAYFLLAPLVGATLYFATSEPIKSLICFLSFLAMEGMYRYLVNFAGFSYVLSPLIFGLIVIALQSRGNLVFNRLNKLPYVGLYLFVLLIGFLQIFNPKGAGIYDGLATYSFWYFCPMMFFPVIYYVKLKRTDFSLFLISLIMISLLVSLVGILQHSQGSVWTYSHFPGSEKTNKMGLGFKSVSVFRPMSTSTMHGGYGLWSAMGILPAFFVIGLPKLKSSIKLICSTVLLVDLYAILISGGRAALMLAIIQIIIYAALKIDSLKSAIRVSLLLIVLFSIFKGAFSLAENSSSGFVGDRFEGILSNPTETFEKSRSGNLTALIPMIAESPFGKGYQRGTSGGGVSTDITSNRETQFAALIADWGLIGMVSMVILSVLFLIKMYEIRKMKFKKKNNFVDISIALLISYIILYFAAPILQANYFFWMLIAFSFRSRNLDV